MKNREGNLRLLTSREIALARQLYGDSIRYHKVWVHHGSYLPFGLQLQNVAMTPNGEMYYRTTLYRNDFADITRSPLPLRHTFMHEMMHIWQHQRHYNVRLRGMFSWAVSYQYELDGRPLSAYGLEQQASIVADYWLLKFHGLENWRQPAKNKQSKMTNKNKEVLLEEYQCCLEKFPYGGK